MFRLHHLLVVAAAAWWSAGAAATPSAGAPAYTVTLAAAPTMLDAGEYSTLTTTASADLTGTRYTTYVFDQTAPTWYRTCKVRTCSFQVTQLTPGTHTYVAYIARERSAPRYPPTQVQATSEPVSVTWSPSTFTVGLEADRTWLPPGATAGLTARTNKPVDGRPVSIQIFDLTDGRLVESCTTGTTCTGFVTQVSPSTRTYQAYVAEPGTTAPPPNVQASSPVVSITWSPFPDPRRPANAGAGAVSGTVRFDPGVPPLGSPCRPVTLELAAAATTAWVNASGVWYVGPLAFSGSGSSGCEGWSIGAGTFVLSASGSSDTGSLRCERLSGGYTRAVTDTTFVVAGDCVVNGVPVVGINVVLKGLSVPADQNGGVTTPVTVATFTGGFAVVPG